MRRRLLTFLAAALLLLCLTACVLWARSYRNQWHGDRFAFGAGPSPWELRSEGGGLTLYRRAPAPWFFAGPSTGGEVVLRYNWHEVIGFPYWMIVIATAPLPGMRAAHWMRRRRRASRGLCLACGYDLRMTPERCPECGVAAQVATPTVAADSR